jgi:TolB protein
MVVPSPGLVAVAGVLALFVASSRPASASFPGRAGKIAFVSDESGSDDILVMNSDGSGRESLTTGPEDDAEPAWSPDGRRLTFVREGPQPVIYLVRADGQGLRRLTVGASPAWSPDGTRIMFSRRIGRRTDLYVVGVGGQRVRRLTRTAAAESEPEWSPDGRRVAFVRPGPDGSADVYVMRSDGRGARRVTSGPLEDLNPTWSPDGRKIAFVRDDESTGKARVYVTTLDGKRVRPLVGKLELDPAASFESDPSWSPDGKRAIFVRGARLYSDLYVASADGRFLRRLTDNALDQVSDRQPAWQPLPRR